MYGRILVPIDGSAPSLKGLDEALKLAKAQGAKLKVVHVVNEWLMEPGYAPAAYYQQAIGILREAGKKVLTEAVERVSRQGLTAESELIETIGGPVADLILDAAKQWRAELIVMGTHGRRGVRRLAMGSDAELVLRRTPVPVLLVRDAPEA